MQYNKLHVRDVYKGEYNSIKVHSSQTINPKYMAFKETNTNKMALFDLL